LTDDGTTRWWWIRHAPIAPPHDQGFAPPSAAAELSDDKSIAGVAVRLPADAVWIASPMRRTQMTCAALRAAKGETATATVSEPAFAEQDFGDWHGQSYRQVFARLTEQDLVTPALVRPPSGEPFEAVVPRVAAAVERLGAEHAGRDLVVIAHAGTIRAALAAAMDLAPPQAISFVVDLLSVTRLDHHPRGRSNRLWSVQFVNCEAR